MSTTSVDATSQRQHEEHGWEKKRKTKLNAIFVYIYFTAIQETLLRVTQKTTKIQNENLFHQKWNKKIF